MVDFNSVLNDARQLSADERSRLIDALWELAPADSVPALHEDWGDEIERRMAEYHAGKAELTTWEIIRDESLRRIRGESQ